MRSMAEIYTFDQGRSSKAQSTLLGGRLKRGKCKDQIKLIKVFAICLDCKQIHAINNYFKCNDDFRIIKYF